MADFQNILAIDSAGSGCGVGVYARGQSFCAHVPMTHGQGERLMPLVQEVMAQAGIKMADVGAVVTTVGPGAFTGLRIGLSAARGLALALNVPVFGMTNLQALALQYAAKNSGKDIVVVLETKRADFYFQKFSDKGAAKSEAAALSGAEIAMQIKDCALIGDAIARFQNETKFDGVCVSGFEHVDAAFMAAQFDAAKSVAAEPLYLRGADVSVSKKIGRPAISA